MSLKKLTYFVWIQLMEHPGNNDQYIQNQCMLVTETQTTAQRPPACNLLKLCTEQGGELIIISLSVQRKQTAEGEMAGLTFLRWPAFLARWKLAVRRRIRLTKRLLRVKTSATTDHCQLSLDTANNPPASMAPGPGPAKLTVTEKECSFSITTITQRRLFSALQNFFSIFLKLC